MDQMMLTSVVLLANEHAWEAPRRARRPTHRFRTTLARVLRSLAAAVEVKPTAICPEPAAAR